ncbi:hypothetical protein Tco_0044755 [Tanacetum coccineum]
MANVLGTLEAANILASGGLKSVFTTASPSVVAARLSVAPASLPVATASASVSTAVATASEKDPTAVVSITTSPATTYTRRTRVSRGIVIESSQPTHTTSTLTFTTNRKGKEKMVKSTSPKTKKTQEELDAQIARELEEEFAQEYQRIREQAARDADITITQVEEDLKQMIDELDRSNEMINKHMVEYEEAENDLTIEEKTELSTELIKYQKDLAQI